MRFGRPLFAAGSVFAALAAILSGSAPRASHAASSAAELRGITASPTQRAAQNVAPGSAVGYALGALLGDSGAGAGFHRGGGCPPKVWGMSRACARMVRKSKLRRLGIGGQRQ